MNSPSPERAKNWQTRVERLIADRDYEGARNQLEVMAQWTDADLQPFVEWARDRLVDVKHYKRSEASNLEAVAKTIRRCLKRHEYKQVLVLLGGIPEEGLTEELRSYRDRAQQRLDRLAELEAELESAYRLGDHEACIITCESILDLKPTHRHAGELYEKLNARGSGGSFKYGKQWSERSGGSPNRKWIWKTVLAVSIPFALLTWGLMLLYLRMGTIEVKIQLTDSARNSDVIVMIDGEPVALTGEVNLLNLKPGEHTLIIRKNGVDIQTAKFTVIENADNAVVIDLNQPAGNQITENPPQQQPQPPENPQPQQPAGVTQTPANQPVVNSPLSPQQVVAQFGSGANAGDLWQDNSLGMKFCWCPPGTFTMGSPENEVDRKGNELQAEVTLTKGFWLGQYEVTQGDWKPIMQTTPWEAEPSKSRSVDSHPVTYITWSEADEFCRKLTTLEQQAGRLPQGWIYSLPSEAEWEYACRAGTTTRFFYGDDPDYSQLGEYAWYADNAKKAGENYSHAVGQKKPNPWNLYDIHGNVYEWCRGYSSRVPAGGTDPEVTTPEGRMFRSRSWGSEAPDVRTARRESRGDTYRSSSHGLRVAIVYTGVGNPQANTTPLPPPSTNTPAPAGDLTEPAANGDQVVISSQHWGMPLGSHPAGTRVTIQYLKGRWANNAAMYAGETQKAPLQSPDDPQLPEDDPHRLVIANLSGGDKPLVVVPANTAQQPFEFTLPGDVPRLALRMQGDSQWSYNEGFVAYRVTVNGQPVSQFVNMVAETPQGNSTQAQVYATIPPAKPVPNNWMDDPFQFGFPDFTLSRKSGKTGNIMVAEPINSQQPPAEATPLQFPDLPQELENRLIARWEPGYGVATAVRVIQNTSVLVMIPREWDQDKRGQGQRKTPQQVDLQCDGWNVIATLRVNIYNSKSKQVENVVYDLYSRNCRPGENFLFATHHTYSTCVISNTKIP